MWGGASPAKAQTFEQHQQSLAARRASTQKIIQNVEARLEEIAKLTAYLWIPSDMGSWDLVLTLALIFTATGKPFARILLSCVLRVMRNVLVLALCLCHSYSL